MRSTTQDASGILALMKLVEHREARFQSKRGPSQRAKPSTKLRVNPKSVSKRTKRCRTSSAPDLFDEAKATKAPIPTSGWDAIRLCGEYRREHLSKRVSYVHADAAQWITLLPENSIHAVVTDPPYGVIEYNGCNQEKLRAGRGGVWRIPPSFDGAKRSPLPRFTILSPDDLAHLEMFFAELGKGLMRVLVPGGHIIIASNPLVSSLAFLSLQRAGFEKRGEVIRLVQTLRGGDRPKGAEDEFADVSMMPRSCWEPWGVFRKPLDGTAASNLRKWGTGGLRRISEAEPFKDVIQCSPMRGVEKKLAPHPSLKPQRFVRQIVRAALPLGRGIVLDPFAGSGSTLAAAEAIGYTAIGTERDIKYFSMGCAAFRSLTKLKVDVA